MATPAGNRNPIAGDRTKQQKKNSQNEKEYLCCLFNKLTTTKIQKKANV